MAKVDETLFETTKSTADLKINSKSSVQNKAKIVSVYDVPLEWIDLVSTKTAIKSMSGYVRQALFEKLMRDGLLKQV
jgi:hypothetical protein